MSANDIKVNINVSDNGTSSKAIKSAKELKSAYDEAAKSASSVGGTAGSRMASQKVVQDYGVSRGISSRTGASARDFAKESQGLGGLVRLYATYAANVFAVGAAFRALREAAGTEIIARGLESMGVASGRALKGLANQVMTLTDGAVSLREAMTSVAQASSAGLGSKQIQDLAVVANKASNALGLNMSDALSRLSHGITKIEPELLDELGIFVKVDQATQDYARSVGKTASTLSDFEKRQAFANAVLEQGKKKFQDIGEVANPYDKLLASVTNLSTKGLDLVNKVLEPIAKILAESPAALAGVFALIGINITKMAIPALGEWRAGLLKSAQESAAAASAISKNFQEMLAFKDISKLDQTVRPIISKVNENLSEVQTTMAQVMSSRSKALQYAMSGNVEASKLDTLQQKEIARRTTILEKTKALHDAEKDPGVKQAFADKLQQQADGINKLRVANALTKQIAVDQQTINKAEEVATNNKGTLAENIGTKLRKMIADRAQMAAASKGILAQVGTDTQTLGMGEAFKRLGENVRGGLAIYDEFGARTDVVGQKLTGLTKAATLARGGFLILGAGITTALTAVAPWLELIGLIVTGLQLLVSWQSKAEKQQEEFNSATTSTSEAITTATKSFDLYITKKHDAFSIDAVTAFSNSISGMADNLNNAVKAFSEWNKQAVWADKVKDWFGTSNLEKTRQLTASTIDQVIKTTQVSSISGGNYVEMLAKSLGLTTDDLINKTDAYNKRMKTLSETDLHNVSAALEIITKQEQNAAQSAQAFSENLQEIDKLITDIENSTRFTTTEGKLGVSLVNASNKLAQALQDPLKTFGLLEKMAGDPKLQALLGGQLQKPVVSSQDLSKQLELVNRTAEKFDKFKQENVRQLKVASASEAALSKNTSTRNKDSGSKALLDNYRSLTIEYVKATQKLEDLRKQAIEYSRSQITLVSTLAQKGMEYAKQATKYAKEQSDISVRKTQLGVLASSGVDVAQQQYQLTLEEIKIQENLADSSFSLEQAIRENTRANQDNTAIQNYIQAQKDLGNADPAVAASAKILVETLKPAFVVALQGKGSTRAMEQLRGDDSAIAAADILARNRRSEDTIANLQREASRASSAAQRKSAEITRDVALNQEEQRRQEWLNQKERSRLELRSQYLKLGEQIVGQQSAELITQTAIEQKAQNKVDLDSQLSKIEQIIKDTKRASTDADYANSLLRIKELNSEKRSAELQKEAKDYIVDFTAELQKQDIIRKETVASQNLETQSLNLQVSKEEDLLKAKTATIDLLAQLGAYDEATLVQKRGEIELESMRLQQKQSSLKLAQDEAQASLQVGQTTINIARVQEDLKTAEGEKKVALEATLAALNKALPIQQQGLVLASQARTQSDSINLSLEERVKKQIELNTYEAKWKDTLSDANNLATDLASAFGSVGEAIGGSVTALLQMTKAQEDFNKIKEASGEDPVAMAKAEKDLQNAQLSGLTKIVSANKKMFDEKSKGYQLMTVLEKGLTAVQAINNALRLKDTIESAYASITAAAPAIMAQFLKDLGPWGFAAGAAAIAAIGGRSPSSPAFRMSSEQLQETQGTGSTYVDQGDGTGRLVATGGGVFGDLKAKSESIDNTLKLMKENQATGIVQNDRLYDAFKKLDDSILAVAGSLPSFQTSLFGTTTGTIKDTVLGGLISSSTANTEIVSSGLYLKGSFLDLSKSVKDLASIFETTKTTTENSYLFGLISGGTDVSYDTSFMGLSNNQQNLLRDMFSVGTDALVQVAGEVGIGRTIVESVLDAIEMTPIDLQGLSLEDQASAIKSVIGSKLADATTALFGANFINAYRKAGEDALDTVVRVLDENDKIAQMVVNLETRYDETGKKLPSVTQSLEGLYGVTNALAEGAGGLKNFVDQYQYFIDNFFSSEEKLALNTKTVTTELNKLGLSQIKTKAQFKSYVQALDLTIPAQRALYQGLMDLAPAFLEVADAASETFQKTIDKFKKFGESLLDFRDSLLLGSTSTLTPLQKYEESRRQFESTYSKALMGDEKAMSDLSGAADSFLESSKIYNASSPQYTQDFNSVLDKVNTALSYSELQVSDAQKQLGLMETQVQILSGIETAVVTTANLLTEASGGTANLSTTPVTSGATTTPSSTPGTLANLGSPMGYSSQTSTPLTPEQLAFFDFLDSSEGQIFKDIRGESLSNAIAAGVRGIFSITGGTALGLGVGAAQYATGAIDSNALSVFESDALAQKAMSDPVLLSTITDAVAAGVSINSIKEALRDSMRAEASTTSFIGDLLRTGSGNLDAATRAVRVASGIISDAAETVRNFDQALTAADSVVSQVYSFSTNPVSTSGTYTGSSGTYTGSSGSSYSYGGGGYTLSSSDMSSSWASYGGYAEGGLAPSGIALVGENGPELVDFQTPGRVYTAEETFGMFNGNSTASQELVREIKELRREVQKLRDQQHEETGNLISAAFEAQSQNADRVTEAVVNSNSSQIWATKLQNTVKLV